MIILGDKESKDEDGLRPQECFLLLKEVKSQQRRPDGSPKIKGA